MAKTVIFRDRQELQAGDLTNVGAFAQEALDRVVRDGVTDERKYSGFAVAKTGATQVSIAPGTYWAGGQRFIREAAHTVDFLSQLPLVTRRVAAIIVVGQTIETDVQPRDFVIDVATGATEPDSVAMQRLRYAEFQVAFGLESPTPQRPTIPTDTIAIAFVTLGTTGVDGVEMATENEVMSNKRLAARATELEAWRREAGEQITTLGSDITTLAQRVEQSANLSLLTRIFADVAVIKDRLDLDDGFSGFGAENWLSVEQSISDPAAVGYAARVEEGLRPPLAAAANTAITLFNPLEPSVMVAADGLCLPRYTQVRRLSLDDFRQQLSLSQYEFQTVEYRTIRMAARRLRFGLAFTVCLNQEFWRTGTFDPQSGIFTDRLGRTYQALDTAFGTHFSHGAVNYLRLQQFWFDEETTQYQDRVVTDHTVTGSMVAQTILNTQGGWMTSLDLYFTQRANTGDVRVLLTHTVGGRPDLDRVIAETTVTPANIVAGTDPRLADQWTRIPFVPTYLAAGERYAIVLITGGNHFVGLTSGANYAAGTLFSSTDGAFFQGDLTLDLMLRANFADFVNTRIEVDLGAISLPGGINDFDVAFEGVAPAGTELFFEVRPQGNARWFRLGPNSPNPFAGLPVLCNFRAVFIGTKDLMPGLRLTGSSILASRPGTAFTWISLARTLPAPTQTVKVIVTLDYFNEANHDFEVRLSGLTGGATNVAAGTVVDEILDNRDGTRRRIRRTFSWTSAQITTPTSTLRLRATGALAAATEMFHGERLVWMTF